MTGGRAILVPFASGAGGLGRAARERETAGAVARCLRRYDTASRLGGGRFGVLLPEADREEAEQVGARVRDAVGALEFPILGRLTVSAGVAACPEAVTQAAMPPSSALSRRARTSAASIVVRPSSR